MLQLWCLYTCVSVPQNEVWEKEGKYPPIPKLFTSQASVSPSQSYRSAQAQNKWYLCSMRPVGIHSSAVCDGEERKLCL
jgi:hypothetical protein